MTHICFYFQVHQPFRLLDYTFFQIGKNHFYENGALNETILKKVAINSYLKTNKILQTLIENHKGKFKIALSLSGTVVEQFQQYMPEVLASFQELAKTGCVEFLAETYYHSLSFLYSKDEFVFQVKKHDQLINQLFGQQPKVFRNTELIFNNELAKFAEDLGYKGILCEGVERILKGRSPHFLYEAPGASHIKCLLRDYKLSDDISFRFSDKGWIEYPLTAKKYVSWIKEIQNSESEVINLFMDYETFGEHQPESSGIFDFLESLPGEILNNTNCQFSTPAEVVETLDTLKYYDCEDFISWADMERDLSAWLSNSMQYETLHKVYALRDQVLATENAELLGTWSRLLTSDHFYYMCTKYFSDGDVHKYFSPFNSPYDAYVFYMNILSDFEITLKKAGKQKN